MKIGVITDAHANLPALEAALAAIDGASCDLTVHTGDAIGIGPHPDLVLERLLARPDTHLLMGNHDEWFALGLPQPQPSWMSDDEYAHQQWVHSVLPPETKPIVAAWPYDLQLDLGSVCAGFCHYPRGDSGNGFASIIREPSASDLDRLFDRLPGEIVFYGHHHPQSDLNGHRRYVNPGALGCHAVGQARFAILEADAGGWNLTLRSVPYDPASVYADLDRRDVPARDDIRRIFLPDLR
jgi:predicted phosphodiesterase